MMSAVVEEVMEIEEDEEFDIDDYISPETEANILEYLEQKRNGTLESRLLSEVAREYGLYY